MVISYKPVLFAVLCFLAVSVASSAEAVAAENSSDASVGFPRSLDSYHDSDFDSITAILKNRILQEPFNLVATLIFLGAIFHTFLTSKFTALAHKWEHAHADKKEQGRAPRHSVHHGAEFFHFLGEVEVVFGIWAVALVGAIFIFYDWKTVVGYISYQVDFTEAVFVVVIMTLASTRPVLKLSERMMSRIANLLGGSLTAWWFTILTLGPVLGSFITEPAAMTISALMLAHKFYDLQPGDKFKYATIGLLFVNISVGGTLTHFAAPPVLMVAGPWNWGMGHMVIHFGWKALVGIVISNLIYFFIFRREFRQLRDQFNLKTLQDEIQQRYLNSREFEAEFNRIGAGVDEELGFTQALDLRLKEMTEKTKSRLADRMKDRHLSSIVSSGIDPVLVRKAFEQRFEEIRLREMRRALPGLLPEDERPDFRDPDWDDRDDRGARMGNGDSRFIYDLDDRQRPPSGTVYTRDSLFPGLCQGHIPVSKPDRSQSTASGRVFPGRARHPRRRSGLVDSAGAGPSEGIAPDAGGHGFNRLQRQCRHHVFKYVRSGIYRPAQVCGGGRRRCRRRPDRHCQCPQSGRPVNPQKVF